MSKTTKQAAQPGAGTVSAAPIRLASYKELHDVYGISFSRVHVRRLIAEKKFPAPVTLGSGPTARKAWRVVDIENWLASLPTAQYQKRRRAA